MKHKFAILFQCDENPSHEDFCKIMAFVKDKIDDGLTFGDGTIFMSERENVQLNFSWDMVGKHDF